MTSMRFYVSMCLVGGALLVACGDDETSGGGGSGGDSAGGSPSNGGGGSDGDGGSGGTPSDGGGGTTADGGGGVGGGAGAFDLQFDGTGYNPHNGQMLYVRVLDAGGTEVAQDTITVEGGTFSFTFTQIEAEGGSVDYYADVDADSACTFGEDHVWRDPIPANHMLAVTHNTNFSQEACDGF